MDMDDRNMDIKDVDMDINVWTKRQTCSYDGSCAFAESLGGWMFDLWAICVDMSWTEAHVDGCEWGSRTL